MLSLRPARRTYTHSKAAHDMGCLLCFRICWNWPVSGKKALLLKKGSNSEVSNLLQIYKKHCIPPKKCREKSDYQSFRMGISLMIYCIPFLSKECAVRLKQWIFWSMFSFNLSTDKSWSLPFSNPQPNENPPSGYISNRYLLFLIVKIRECLTFRASSL